MDLGDRRARRDVPPALNQRSLVDLDKHEIGTIEMP